MPVYKYEAKTMDGVIVRGKMEALDENTVTSFLRQKNYYPIDISQYKESLNIDVTDLKKISIKDIAIFCRQFSFTISSGINILRALEIVKEQTESKKLKKILNRVFEDVQRGKGLSEAMKEHKEMPLMLVNMIEVGEVSGTLDKIMIRMAEYYDKDYKQQQKVKGALTYPAIICAFAILVVAILIVKVLPTFVNMISSEGGNLPAPTRFILGISSFLQRNGIFVLIALIGIFVGLKYVKDTNVEIQEAFDKMKLNMPVFGKIIKKIITARFARTFGTLISSGVSLIPSLEICASVVGNVVIKKVLDSSKEELKKGGSLGETLEIRNIFPLMLTQMIKIGEESGTLDSVLEKTAEFYDGEVETATQQLTTLIEPVIIIILAVVVGFIVAAMILPMFEMYNNLNNSA